jgi:PBP1b-binding outer membrane lipoprotein LpoB
VDYLPTAKMTADGMTKMLSPQKHKEFIKQLGLVDTKHLVEMEKMDGANASN